MTNQFGADVAKHQAEFRIGQRVQDISWGAQGIVEAIDGEIITIRTEDGLDLIPYWSEMLTIIHDDRESR